MDSSQSLDVSLSKGFQSVHDYGCRAAILEIASSLLVNTSTILSTLSYPTIPHPTHKQPQPIPLHPLPLPQFLPFPALLPWTVLAG